MGEKMPYVPWKERDSEYYRKLAKLRKHPYPGFAADKKFAKKASKLGVEAKRKKRVLHKKQLLQHDSVG